MQRIYDNRAKTLIFTSLALIAFAANSVLCRMALGGDLIDATGFTLIRLLSGVLVLFIILKMKSYDLKSESKGSWKASVALFIYALSFSYAYITLDTGVGALILFGAVQTTMILLSLFSGNRVHKAEWLGMFISFSGFVYLVFPTITTPSIIGFILMSLSGIAWGIYTLKGRDSKNPLLETSYNFLRTIPFIIVVALITLGEAHYSLEGMVLAVLSGGIASGIGYTLWYIALGGLSVTEAAVIQLSVPIIAAIGGVIFMSELITLRLSLSGAMILGGILLVIVSKYYLKKVSSHE